MNDLKNMNAVSKQIITDKRITLAASILGVLIGAGCVVLSIHVALG
jgi:hypothetical protein